MSTVKERIREARPTLPALPDNIAKALLGRPTNYRVEFCEQVIQAAVEGFSLVGFGGLIGVNKDTLWDWTKRHPAFSDACARAGAGRLWFWESRLIHVANTGGSGSQGTVAMFGVINAARTVESTFASPWINKTEIEHNHNISLAGVVERMMQMIEAKGADNAKIIEHVQADGETSSGDLFGDVDT